MECEKCRLLMDRYILGELSLDHAENVRDHLLECRPCQQQLEWAREALQNREGLDRERNRHQSSILIEKRHRRLLKEAETPAMRMVKWILIGSCFALVVLGVQLRSDKFKRSFPEYHAETQSLSTPEMITATLNLTKQEAATFFPLYEQARREVRELQRQRELNEIRIVNLSEEGTAAPLEELLDKRSKYLELIEERRNQFYQELSNLLGVERAGEILIIEDKIW
ncbi:MAG: zf-HC2 domain-containing protein [Candidatus Delongbacteria bacterium]|nr:zf-HC2 domain-containing protein [bacterium]MBL7033183.1 zf-HC2 domain-containing protein [Candidatus Delongbacteria bacterium]